MVTVISDLNAAVNLMQYMLKKVTSCCLETGLRVNPDQTELVIFTRKHKVLPLISPSLAGKRLEAKNAAKYLGVILNRKINWTRSSMRLSSCVRGLFFLGKGAKN